MAITAGILAVPVSRFEEFEEFEEFEGIRRRLVVRFIQVEVLLAACVEGGYDYDRESWCVRVSRGYHLTDRWICDERPGQGPRRGYLVIWLFGVDREGGEN